MKKIMLFLSILIGVRILVFVLIQFVTFGHDPTNPATVSEPQWSSPEARAIIKENC
jgi:hypothetical protein